MRGLARVFAVAALLAAAMAQAEQPIRPWTGKATPRLALRDLGGHEFDLHALQGRVVLVNFWATWCEPCITEMPALQRLRAKLDGAPSEVVAVNYGESRAKVQDYLRRAGLTLEVLLDPDQRAADDWNAKGLPMTFLVDARGRVRYWVFGERDWSEGESLRVVESLVAEVPHARR